MHQRLLVLVLWDLAPRHLTSPPVRRELEIQHHSCGGTAPMSWQSLGWACARQEGFYRVDEFSKCIPFYWCALLNPLTRNSVLICHLSRPGRFRPLLKYFVKSDGLSVGGLDAEPLRPNSTHLWAYQLAGSDHGLSFPTTFPGASGGASFAWLDVLRTVLPSLCYDGSDLCLVGSFCPGLYLRVHAKWQRGLETCGNLNVYLSRIL